MTISALDVLRDCFGRVHERVPALLAGLTPADLVHRVGPDANPVGWLVWHLSRVQDDHLADVAGVEQVWTAGGWCERFGLPYEVGDIGFGQDSEAVGAFSVTDPGLLTGYHEAVHALTLTVLDGLEGDLRRVVDERWNPPVTAAARLVSVVADTLQHVGQAGYVRGLLRP